mmetsp:Transcript_18184/g.42297  ORF Transcript_18184/g.42297 Transcript_18184/m.42297 type:complete len:275 (-) Transcript_18184:342-1166(-)
MLVAFLIIMQLRSEVPVADFYGLNLTVQLVHVCHEAEVPLFNDHEYLHDLFYVTDASAALDGRERLLKDLNVLLMYPDVPPQDCVQEGDLQDSAMHCLLREGLLFICNHVVLLPWICSFVLPTDGARRIIHLVLDSHLLLHLRLESFALVLKSSPFTLQLSVQRSHLLLGIFTLLLSVVHIQGLSFQLLSAALDVLLQLSEHLVQGQALSSQTIYLRPEMLIVGIPKVKLCICLLKAPLSLLHLMLCALRFLVTLGLHNLILLPLGCVLLLCCT